MAEARERSEWNRASAVMAMVHNVQCTRRGDMRPPSAFHPMPAAKGAGSARRAAGHKVPISALRGLFERKGFKSQAG